MKSDITENIEDLVSRCQKGDKSAQYRLYLNFVDAMFAICKRMVANVPDAEDVLQDAFVIAFTRIDKLKDKRRFGGWLKRITINECVNFVNRKNIHFDDLDDNIADEEDDNKGDGWEVDAGIIKQAIAELPVGSRIIFNLHLIENYKHKEIADILHISESTSKSQYQRAKRLLKEKLTNTNHER